MEKKMGESMEVGSSTTKGQSPSTNTNPNTVIDKI